MIGLDPSFVAPEWAPFSLQNNAFAIRTLTAPLLVLASGHDRATAPRSQRVLDSLHLTDRYFMHVGASTHGDFSDYPLIMGAVRGAATVTASIAAHHEVARTTLRFMATLRGPLTPRAVARKALQAAFDSTGARGGFFHAATALPSIVDIERVAARLGYDSAMAMLVNAQRRNPAVVVASEAELNASGYRLLSQSQAPVAITVFRLNTHLFPRSANAWDSLADGHIAVRDVQSAVAAYRRALDVDANYVNARAARRFVDENK